MAEQLAELNKGIDKTWTFLKTVTGGTLTSFPAGYSEYFFHCGTPYYQTLYYLPNGVAAGHIIAAFGATQGLLLTLDANNHQVKVEQAVQDGVVNTNNAYIRIYGR